MSETNQKPSGASAPAVSVGMQLRALREGRGLSLGALARLSGVSGATLSRWESGKRQPLIPELEAVLRALDAGKVPRRDILRQINAPRALIRLRHLDAAASPVGGTLLHALRLRKGWTQAETGRAVKVNQSQIARWEQGDAWPGGNNLHVLCWHLGASIDEMAELSALSAGQFAHPNTLNAEEPEFPPEGKTFSPEAILPWVTYVEQHLFRRLPAFTLSLFQLQHRLSVLAAYHPIAEQLLPNAYAVQARHHLQHGENQQAVILAQRGLALARRQRLPPGDNASQSLWFGNAIVLASITAKSGSQAGLRRAVQILTQWLPAVEECSAHHAWGSADLASYLGRLGCAEEAVTLSTRVCRNVAQTAPGEEPYRLHDHARILCQSGRPREALRALSTSRTLTEHPDSFSSYFALRQELLESQCLLALQDRSGADARLRAAERLVQAYHLNPALTGYIAATAQIQKTANN